jgi:DNA-binding beta-propeller fold protein YncE
MNQQEESESRMWKPDRISRAVPVPVAVLVCTVLVATLLCPSLASADFRIGEFGNHAGQLHEPFGLAVNRAEGGNVYVLDAANQRVDVFEPNGNFVRAFGWNVNATTPEEKLQTCTAFSDCRVGSEGSSAGQLSWSDEIAIDNSCAEQEPPLTGSACETFDPSYGDVYVVDQRNFRVEKFAFNPISHEYEFVLMFGGEVDKTAHANVCTAASGHVCGAGITGTEPAHFYRSVECKSNVCSGSWSNEGNNAIAVGPDGSVYVGDYGRIQEFSPQGEFEGELKLEDPEKQFVTSLAVDNQGDIFERSAVYSSFRESVLSQVAGVREYEPGQASPVRTVDAEEALSRPTHIAVDNSGNIFLSNFNGDQGFDFRAFKPSGALFAVFTSPLVHPVGMRPFGIALDPATKRLYALSAFTVPNSIPPDDEAYVAAITLPEPGPPAATEASADKIEPTTAELHATANADGYEAQARFEYLTEAEYQANPPSERFSGAEQTPAVSIGALIQERPIAASLSSLHPGTIYRYRAVVESECEPEAHPLEKSCKATSEAAGFESLPPVGIAEFATQRVAPEEVTLKAKLSPNNGSNTEYTISYGDDETCSSSSVNHKLEGVVGNEFKTVEASFEQLQPNTPYHYCLEATNSYGEPVHVGRAFTTEETIAEQDSREGCPNSLRREEDNSTTLSDCRAYEEVSPAFKQGYPASGAGLAPSGEGAAYASSGAFAGAQVNEVFVEYFAQRGPTGWSTVPVLSHPGGPNAQVYQATDYNSELDRWLFSTIPGGSTLGAKETQTSQTLYLGSPEAGAVPAAPPLTPVEGGEHTVALSVPYGQSEDLSDLFLATGFPFVQSDARPGPPLPSTRIDRLYAVQGAGGPSPALSLAVELPPNLVTSISCAIEPGLNGGGHWQRTASADGAELFYQEPLEVEAGKPCGSEGPNKYAVFACHIATGPCVEGQPGYHEAVRLSAPPASECHSPSPCASAPPANAQYLGASPDGRLVWFTTAQPLIDSDTDETSDLYLAKLSEAGQLEELVQVSAGESGPEHPVAGAAAGVVGTVKFSSDGAHAAFVATGALTTNPNPVTGQGAAAGAENLYVYDAGDEVLKFVARLCSGPGLSGSVPDPSCGPSLEGQSGYDQSLSHSLEPQAAFTPDGRFFLFGSYGRLTSDDTDGARDLYRYDVQTGGLIRISIGRRGNDGGGNDNAFSAEILGPRMLPPTEDELAEDFTRPISADGSVVVFHTPAPLVSRDTDEGSKPGCGPGETGCDVYEWTEAGRGHCSEAGGCVSLVSSGAEVHGAKGGVVSDSGRDIAFSTGVGLAPADTDGVSDIYDAREGGGFPYAKPPELPCQEGSAEACHGESTREVLKPAYTSEGTQSGGNGPQQLQCAKGRHKVKKRGQVRCVPNKAKHNKKRAHHHKKRAARRYQGGRK